MWKIKDIFKLPLDDFLLLPKKHEIRKTVYKHIKTI